MAFHNPVDESARIAKLHQLSILDTAPEHNFDELNRLASQICQAPIALISFVDQDRQWFKSKIGLDESETSRAIAFCHYTISQKDPLIVCDATLDRRFTANPLVTGKPFIRFYAGFPILSIEGFALGTLNVIDIITRELAPEQLEGLRTVANQVSTLIQLREHSILLAQTNQHLKTSEEKYRLVAESASDMIITVAEDNTITFVNHAVERILGYRPEELIGKSLLTIIPLNLQQKHLPEMRRFLKTKGNKIHRSGVEALARHLSGEEVHIEITFGEYHQENTRSFTAVIRDITQRKRMEAALLESRQMLELVINAIPNSVFWKARNSVYLGCNRNFAEIMKLDSPSEINGKSDYELPALTKEQADYFRNYDQRIMETGIGEYQLVAPLNVGGKQKWLSTSKIPLSNAKGEVIGLLGAIEDITDRKEAEIERGKLEEQLLQAQKMESVGRLAGGVAHDFNNLLTIILSSIQLARLTSLPDVKLQQRFDEIEGAAERAASLTRRLLAFSRHQHLKRQNINLNTTITDILKILQRIIGENIEIIFHAAPNLELIYADVTQIEQVIMNLAVNARDAMPDGGRLIIETQNIVLREDYNRSHVYLKPGKYVRLQISDSGSGMDENVKQHIFEPFFTTKEVGRGTGLGLSTVYGIIKQHESGIDVYSEPGQGTIFNIYFPALKDKEATAETGQESRLRFGSETVLIAEDEKSLRELAKEILEQLGYKIITAQDGMEAVEIYQKQKDEIDLVMLDLIMPRMGGIKAFEQIRTFSKTVPIIFMTGYSDKMFDLDFNKQFTDDGKLQQAFIQKPYSVLSLSQIIQEMLEN